MQIILFAVFRRQFQQEISDVSSRQLFNLTNPDVLYRVSIFSFRLCQHIESMKSFTFS